MLSLAVLKQHIGLLFEEIVWSGGNDHFCVVALGWIGDVPAKGGEEKIDTFAQLFFKSLESEIVHSQDKIVGVDQICLVDGSEVAGITDDGD